MTDVPSDREPPPRDSSGAPQDAAERSDGRTQIFDGDDPPARRVGPRRAEAVAAIKPGALLGRFQVERRLGSGGMGEVFLARDPDLDRQVAIKVLSGPAAADPAARVRFLLEGRAAGRVSHPNIVGVHEVGPPHLADSVRLLHDPADDAAGDAAGEEPNEAARNRANAVAAELDGPAYLVMDYACDGSVDDLLRSGPLSVERATAVLVDAAAGLAAAHQAGMVHRDVKPANLMLEGGGPWAGGMVKVTDFGLARRLVADHAGDSDSGSFQTDGRDRRRRGRRKVAGTPHYMSPEQVRGGSLDARCDIYSLGATYHTLLAGRPPFAADPGQPPRPVTAVLNAQKRTDPPPVHELKDLGAAVPPACTRIIVRAMAKDPADRYPTAGALRLDALALLDAFRGLDPDATIAGLAEFALPSERPDWASRPAGPSSVENSGTAAKDVGRESAAARESVAFTHGPPPGVRREVFSLEEGEIALTYPASLKNARLSDHDADRLRAWLNLVRVKLLSLAEDRPKP